MQSIQAIRNSRSRSRREKAMSDPIFKDEALITATVASLKKWQSVSIETLSEQCGFCDLIVKYEKEILQDQDEYSMCPYCPVTVICYENLDFWSEIEQNPRKSFNPGKSKYQQRRIQKNIDWLKDYLMKLRAKTITVQCRMCEAGKYDSLDSLKEHLEKEHELTEDDLIQYGEHFSDDVLILIYKEKRAKLSDEAREICAKSLGLKE